MARELRLDGRRADGGRALVRRLLALHWAAHRRDVRHVVCFSTPLYVDALEADERIATMGRIERLFAPQGAPARAVCGWMCRHRAVAQWVAVAVEPRWPVVITRMAVRHSWASYTGTMNGVIRHGGWETPLRALEAAGVPVLLADGAADPVPVRERAAGVAGRHPNVTATTHPTAGHQLPITHPTWCVNLVTARGGLDRDAAQCGVATAR